MVEYHDLANYDLPILDCYERDYYIFSNFSAFAIFTVIDGNNLLFPTSEHLYHFYKFKDTNREVAIEILNARSADEALRIADKNKDSRRADWNDVKIDIMEQVIREKIEQHPYVKKKLIASGDNPIVECSWRDDYWGWGPNKDGQNQLGKIWMKVRKDYV